MSEFFIESQRLILRDYRTVDFERVHLYGSDPDFSKYEAWGPNTADDTRNFIALKQKDPLESPRFTYDLAVCLKEDHNILIGGCRIGLESQTSAVASMGWAINPDYQSQGYATEAASALIHFGFEKLQLKVIYATCDTRNIASYKVMEKLGMKRVGCLKAHKTIKGFVRDSYRYEIYR